MADDIIQLDADGVGKKLDTDSLTVGANTVHRERIRIAGATATQLAPVSATEGLLVQLGPTDNAVLDAAVALLTTIDADTGAIVVDSAAIEALLVLIEANQLPDGHSVALSATDNAVLDAIAASVAALDTDATTIIGHLDGVETLLGTIDADTGAIAIDAAAIEALLTTIEANQLADGHNVVVTATPKSSTVTAHAQTSISNSNTVVLSANANRKRFMIQNTGTTIIYLGFTSTNPTVTSYHVALAACTVANDGTGGTYIDDLWTGVVEAIATGAGGTAVVSEFT